MDYAPNAAALYDMAQAAAASTRMYARACCLPLALIAVLAAALAASPEPALAFSQRGHAFGFTLGSAGTGRGQFAEKVGPAGVAVSESTGDVYAVDPGNDRIDQFGAPGPSGEPNAPVAAWGWGVSDGKAEYEVCTSGCQKGIAGTGGRKEKR